MMNEMLIIRSGNWEAIYINGVKIVAGKSISFLELFNIGLARVPCTIKNRRVDMNFNFPERLNES